MGCPSITKLDLRVVAQGVEESIAVGGHAAGAIRDRLAQAPGRIEGGKLHHQASVDIDVGGRIVFENVRAGGLDIHRCLRSRKPKRDL